MRCSEPAAETSARLQPETGTTCMSQIQIVEGDLLDQDVEVIVNAWNRNIIPCGCCFRRAFHGRSRDELDASLSGSRQNAARFHLAVPS